ncbi:MAG: hypothetical protein BGN92_07155 [Sphingobacteriales bacterium 41-5]|nr:MAG: hypothetical protein BGN92_07155 [Sphingobacteriales bacterium 41-5]
MNKHNTGKAFEGAHPKDTESRAVYNYLFKRPATATQVSVALKIYRPNLCRRKRTLEKVDKLRQVKKVICPITKHWAWQLTCTPDLFPKRSQLNLFGEGGPGL